MKISKQPQNTEAVSVYLSQSSIILQRKIQNTEKKSQFLVIDRKTSQIKKADQCSTNQMNKRSFSACLGVIDFDGYKFLLLCDEARIVSTVDGLEVFQVCSLFFLSYIDERQLKLKPERKQIYKKIRQYYLILSMGFYFSYKYNLSQSFQNRNLPTHSTRYTWNFKLLEEFDRYQVDNSWKLPLIQGFVRSFQVFIEGTKLSYVLISRRSNKKGGTRYFDRGLNEDGFVANFVQTQQIIKLDQYFISDLQIRGSVPLFFEQIGLTTQLKLTRGYELTHEIYKKHLTKLLNQYKRVFFVNLLSVGKAGQKKLIDELQKHIRSQIQPNLKYMYYDFHKVVKGGYYQKVDQGINTLRQMKLNLRYHIFDSKKQKILDEQSGIFRTNCLDCLDRTNFFQAKLALITLQNILKQFNVCQHNLLQQMLQNSTDNDFIKKFRNIWADNGDAISYHYTGTGSTHTDITRDGKRGWLGDIKHKYKTITRFYNQNFWDFYKMRLVDQLLGEKRGKVAVSIGSDIKSRQNQFCQKEIADVYVFSWKAPKKLPKSLVLFPNEPAILAINVQQCSDVSAWCLLIQQAVDTSKYILICQKTSNNNLLRVYAFSSLRQRISFVQSSKVKFKSYYNTMLSSKCAVIIRFCLDSTKLTFIGCQLEYGRQFSMNRIKNLRQIHQYAFQEQVVGQQKSDPILQDDVIFLFGNMNTNIDAKFKNDFGKFTPPGPLKQQQRILLRKMMETDQFDSIRQNLLEYREYEEQEIKFAPTYKYSQLGYDPDRSGWPDRIFFSTELKIATKAYSVLEEMRDQHVPVIGWYCVEVESLDQSKVKRVCEDIFKRALGDTKSQGIGSTSKIEVQSDQEEVRFNI